MTEMKDHASRMSVYDGQGCESQQEAEKGDRKCGKFPQDIFTDDIETAPKNKSQQKKSKGEPFP